MEEMIKVRLVNIDDKTVKAFRDEFQARFIQNLDRTKDFEKQYGPC